MFGSALQYMGKLNVGVHLIIIKYVKVIMLHFSDIKRVKEPKHCVEILHLSTVKVSFPNDKIYPEQTVQLNSCMTHHVIIKQNY